MLVRDCLYRFIVQVDIKVKCLEPLPAASSSVAAGWLLDNSGSCHRRPAVRRRRYSIRRVHRFAIGICLRDMNCGLSMLCADVSLDLDSWAGVITLNSALGWSALVFCWQTINTYSARMAGRVISQVFLQSLCLLSSVSTCTAYRESALTMTLLEQSQADIQ